MIGKRIEALLKAADIEPEEAAAELDCSVLDLARLFESDIYADEQLVIDICILTGASIDFAVCGTSMGAVRAFVTQPHAAAWLRGGAPVC